MVWKKDKGKNRPGWPNYREHLPRVSSTSSLCGVHRSLHSVSGTASTGCVGADDAYNAALAEAQKHCDSMAKRIVIDSTIGTATGGGEQMPVNNQRIIFRCVDCRSRTRSRARRRAKIENSVRPTLGCKQAEMVWPKAYSSLLLCKRADRIGGLALSGSGLRLKRG